MTRLPKLVLLVSIAACWTQLLPQAALAQTFREADSPYDVTDIFESAGVDGALVVMKLDGDIVHVHNTKRALQPYSPASTFKIVNTLIALERGIADVETTRFRWDGVDRDIAAWNQDQSLRSAFQVSCVWCYQQLAREVGREAYEEDLASIGYGNGRIGERVDQFWLDGSLQISAMAQARQLVLLWTGDLPFSAASVEALKAVMLAEETDAYRLYAKTGWTGASLAVGWYVGILEAADATYAFALNMHMIDAAEAPLRRDLALKSLRRLELIE